MVPWRGRECVQQRRLFRWGRSAKACWTHNDIENKQWWMGTWSPRNHRTLNGKSLSSGAQPSSSTTGRPRRQGVKVHRLCVSVCVRTAYDTHRKSAAHICTNTWREDADTHEKNNQPKINLMLSHAQSRRCILTYKYTPSHSLPVSHIHSVTGGRGGDFPINHQQQYYSAIHCRRRDWWRRGKAWLRRLAALHIPTAHVE